MYLKEKTNNNRKVIFEKGIRVLSRFLRKEFTISLNSHLPSALQEKKKEGELMEVMVQEFHL